MNEDILLQAMVAAVRYASARTYFSDQPDAKMRQALKPVVKPEWLVSTPPPVPQAPKPESIPEHRGPGRPRKV